MARPKKYDDKFINGLADKLLEWIKGDSAYFLKKFAIENGFSAQRLSEFAQTNDKFSDALKRAKDVQEARLFDLGLVTKNQSFVIFALKNVAGWRDTEKENNNTESQLVNININRDAD